MKIKRILSMVLVIALCLSLFSINTIIATAETEYFTSDDGWRYYINKQGSVQIVGYSGVEKDIIVPLEINNIKVNAIQSLDNQVVEKITIPDGIGADGREVFSDCISLQTVNLPADLETIGYGAFFRCRSLKNIDIPESVSTISATAFESTGLESIIFPENCKTFGNSVFSNCSNLKEVIMLSDNINYLEFDAIHDNDFEPVRFCENTFPAHFFIYCSNLRTFDIPDKVTCIEKGAFMNSGIETITFPENCEKFSNYIFFNCENLREIIFKNRNINYHNEYHDYSDGIIKKTYNNMLPYNFAPCCPSLKSINIPESVKSIGESAFAYSGLTSIIIPKNVKTIYKNAFKGCENLASVKFAGAVNNIGKSAFSKCVNLKTVNFTKGYLKKVYDYAFYKCEKLDKVTISNTKNVPTIAKSAFNKAKSGIKFYVKNNTVAKKLKAKLQKTNIKKAKIYRSAPILIYKNVG